MSVERRTTLATCVPTLQDALGFLMDNLDEFEERSLNINIGCITVWDDDDNWHFEYEASISGRTK